MRVEDIVSFGMPPGVVEVWRDDGIRTLLPLQAAAVKSYGLLDGKSLLINGPTSSGKTLCGELAAMRAVAKRQKAIILVPLKAIAAEKYHELRKRYRKLKSKILIVSSDYPNNKEPFLKAKYDIAIVVYEMFNGLSSTDLKLLESVGTVVFDEFQLICENGRGLVCESALAKVRHYNDSIQIVGLLGGYTECSFLERWLAIPVLNSTNRPVELHRGVLFNGKFYYKRYNDYTEGIEYFRAESNDNCIVSEHDGLNTDQLNSIKYIVNNDEQALIFVPDRSSSLGLARIIAEVFDIPEARGTIENLNLLPETLQKTALIECLKSGVAYHNADLGLSMRKIVETGFREGEIRLLICTSTLAMGVNLPSRNVFINPQRYYSALDGTPVLKILKQYDYNQMSGRAGRLGQEDNFGRAVIIAEDDNDRENIRDYFINNTISARPGVSPKEQLALFTLGLISCGIIRDYGEAKNQLKRSLRGFAEKIETQIPTEIVDELIRQGFTTINGCRLECTAIGQAAVSHNIELHTAASIRDGFDRHGLEDGFISWLYYLTGIPECQRELIGKQNVIFREPIDIYLRSCLVAHKENETGPLKQYLDYPEVEVDSRRLMTTMMLVDIIQPIPTIELERKYDVGWGRLKKYGEYFSKMLRAAIDIGKANGLNKNQLKYLREIARAICHCVPKEVISLARLQIPFLERDFILRLSAIGINTRRDVIDSDFETLLTAIPQSVAEKLFKECTDNCRKLKADNKLISKSCRPPLRAIRDGVNYVVELDERPVILQPRLFKYFQQLYYNDNNWLHKNSLDSGLNQVKYIYKLRKAIEHLGNISIESDNAGNYRLVIGRSKSLAKTVKPSALISEK